MRENRLIRVYLQDTRAEYHRGVCQALGPGARGGTLGVLLIWFPMTNNLHSLDIRIIGDLD